MCYVEGVVFDLDGTLVDTLHSIGNAVNEVFVGMGLPPVELESLRGLIGGGPECLFHALTERLPQSLRRSVGDCMREMERFDSRYWIATAEVFDGVDSMLDALAEVRVPFAVVTNKRHHVAVPMIAEKFGTSRFVAVYGAGPGVPMKPNPTETLKALKAMGVSRPEHVAFVGDTEIDIETAVRAGCVPIGVEWGFRSKTQLLEAGAVKVLRHPLELVDAIGSDFGPLSSHTARRNAAGDTPTWR